MDLVDPASQVPPIWPSGPLTYTIAQLRIEFPFTDTREIHDATHRAAGRVTLDQGPMMLLRSAREILRAKQTQQAGDQTKDFRKQESA